MGPTTQSAVLEWIQEAIGEIVHCRRQHLRFPCFRQFEITSDVDRQTKLPAFGRDISSNGIGLLHDFSLEPGHHILTISSMSASQLDVTIRIKWCHASGEGWYISGGSFVDLSTLTTASLLLPSLLTEASFRLKQRYVFLRPISIAIPGSKNLSAFCRDISGSDVTLLHRTPLERQSVILTMATESDSFDISAKIIWCRSMCKGWYLSAGRFRHLMIEQLEERRL